jgi:DNA topoisomerase-1
VFEIGLNRAVSLLAEKAASSRGRRGANVIKDLGEHPELRGKVQVLTGRYGPYVKHGKVNATLPRDREPEQVTLEEAVALIAAKGAKGTAKKAGPKKPARKAGKSNKEAVEETAG